MTMDVVPTAQRRRVVHRSGTHVGGILLMLTDRGIPWWGLVLAWVVALWAEAKWNPSSQA